MSSPISLAVNVMVSDVRWSESIMFLSSHWKKLLYPYCNRYGDIFGKINLLNGSLILAATKYKNISLRTRGMHIIFSFIIIFKYVYSSYLWWRDIPSTGKDCLNYYIRDESPIHRLNVTHKELKWRHNFPPPFWIEFLITNLILCGI